MNNNLSLGRMVCVVALLGMVLVCPAFGQRASARNRFLNMVKVHKNLEYAKIDGQSLKLDLYLPKEMNNPPPLLVWIHGGGWISGTKKHVKRPVLKLVLEGYAIASIDYLLTNISSHPDQIHDCKGAIRWLRANAKTYGYDATRIGAGGGSAGGHLVLLLGLSHGNKTLEGTIGGNLDQSSTIQAMVDFYGPSDLTALWDQKQKLRERFENHPNPHPLLQSASPLTHLSNDDPPLLIFHGDQDPVVPVEQSKDLHKQYQQAHLQSTLHIFKGAGHGGKVFQSAIPSRMVKAFFDRYIKQIKTNEPAN